MTIQQLQYVLEIRKTGSISKAAKNLYLSQPNISNAVKNLERELGITIFERTTAGVQFTSAGNKLADRAEKIIADLREVIEEQHTEGDTSFRLLYPRFVPAYDAFVDLCHNCQDSPSMHLSCHIGGSVEQQLEAIYRNRCDLGVSLWTDSAQLDKLCADFHVVRTPLHQTRFYVQLAENHPLLQTGQPFDPSKLADYPCVVFLDRDASDTSWSPWQSFVDPNKLIQVESTASRVPVVANTTAYSIVLPHSDEYNATHHVVQIPLQCRMITAGILYSSERGLSPLAREYIRLLRLRLRSWPTV